jgi:hypothetical protein
MKIRHFDTRISMNAFANAGFLGKMVPHTKTTTSKRHVSRGASIRSLPVWFRVTPFLFDVYIIHSRLSGVLLGGPHGFSSNVSG